MMAEVVTPRKLYSISPAKAKCPTYVVFAGLRGPTRAPPKEHRGNPTARTRFPDFAAIPAEKKRWCRSLSSLSFHRQLRRKLRQARQPADHALAQDRKSTRLNSSH